LENVISNDKGYVIAKHMCNPGDLIASMAGLKSCYEKTGKKILLCQMKDIEANYYQGAIHGTTDSAGRNVMMNQHVFDMIKPLVDSQEYIHEMQIYEGQSPLLIDIDIIRKEKFVNLPHGQIQAWIFMAFPDLSYDLSKPWIHLPEIDLPIIEKVKGKIILNFTERYRNPHINYFFLKKFKNRLLFSGTAREHLLFMNKWKMDVPMLETKDFLELAYGLKHCKFLLSNQSMMWNLAESMKSPRILEICEYAQNCMGFVGEKSYGFFHQQGLEYYVDIMTGD